MNGRTLIEAMDALNPTEEQIHRMYQTMLESKKVPEDAFPPQENAVVAEFPIAERRTHFPKLPRMSERRAICLLVVVIVIELMIPIALRVWHLESGVADQSTSGSQTVSGEATGESDAYEQADILKEYPDIGLTVTKTGANDALWDSQYLDEVNKAVSDTYTQTGGSITYGGYTFTISQCEVNPAVQMGSIVVDVQRTDESVSNYYYAETFALKLQKKGASCSSTKITWDTDEIIARYHQTRNLTQEETEEVDVKSDADVIQKTLTPMLTQYYNSHLDDSIAQVKTDGLTIADMTGEDSQTKLLDMVVAGDHMALQTSVEVTCIEPDEHWQCELDFVIPSYAIAKQQLECYEQHIAIQPVHLRLVDGNGNSLAALAVPVYDRQSVIYEMTGVSNNSKILIGSNFVVAEGEPETMLRQRGELLIQGTSSYRKKLLIETCTDSNFDAAFLIKNAIEMERATQISFRDLSKCWNYDVSKATKYEINN